MKKVLSSILVSASLLVAPFALANSSEETAVETTKAAQPAGKKVAEAGKCHVDEKTKECMCDGKKAEAAKCEAKK